MAVIAQVRAGNLTAFDRADVVTTVLHLAPGAFNAFQSPRQTLTAVGATEGNERVQWYPMGPRYPDGTAKLLLVHFPVTIDSGGSAHGYTNYAEKVIDIRDDLPTAQRAHVTHPSVAASLFTQSLAFVVGGDTVDLNLSGVGGTTVVEDEPDLDNPANANLRTLYARRVWTPSAPPDPPEANPRWCLEFWFEIPHNLPFIKWTMQVTNGVIADDATPHRLDTIYNLPAPIDVQFPAGADFNTVILGEDSVVDATLVAGERFRLVNNQHPNFMFGYGPVWEGVTSYLSGLSATELEYVQSMEAEPRTYAPDANIKDKQFGIFNVVPVRPDNTVLTSDSVAFDQAAAKARTHRTSYTTTRDAFRTGLEIDVPRTKATGSRAGFGALKLHHLVWSGVPDLRGAHIDALQDASRRPIAWREENGEWVNPERHNQRRPTLWSNIVCWQSWTYKNFNSSQYPQPIIPAAWGIGLGIGRHFGNMRRAPPWNSDQWDWWPPDDEHPTCTVGAVFTLLSGNRWMRKFFAWVIDLARLNKYVPDDPDIRAATVHRLNSDRSEGRWFIMALWAYAINGDARVLQWCRDRYNIVWTNATYGGGFHRRAGAEMRYFTEPYNAAWRRDLRLPFTTSWQNAILASACWAANHQFRDTVPAPNTSENMLAGASDASVPGRVTAIDGAAASEGAPEAEWMGESDALQNADTFRDRAWDFSRMVVMDMTRDHPTNGVEFADYVTLMPNTDIGERLSDAQRSDNGWSNSGPFAYWENNQTGTDRQVILAVQVAWAEAVRRGDATVTSEITRIWNDRFTGIEETHRGVEGWGGSFWDSWYDWAGAVSEPWAAKSIGGPRNMTPNATIGMSSGMTVAAQRTTWASPDLTLSAGMTVNRQAQLPVNGNLHLDALLQLQGVTNVDIPGVNAALSMSAPLSLDHLPAGGDAPKPIPLFVLIGSGQAVTQNIGFDWAIEDQDPKWSADPQGRGIHVWNWTTADMEEFTVLTSNGTARGNSNTHPDWNGGSVGNFIGPDIGLAFKLRTLMGQDVAILKLGVPDASIRYTTTSVAATNALPDPANPTRLLVGLGTPHSHKGARSFRVTLAGITGITPDPNKESQAFVVAGTNSVISVELGSTVSGSFAGAGTCAMPKPSFLASEKQVWQDLVSGFNAFREHALTTEGYDLDARGIFTMFGTADAIAGQTSTYQADLTAFVAQLRGVFATRSTGLALPVIMGKLVSHADSPLDPGAVSDIRAAQVAVAAADSRVHLVDLDTVDIATSNLWNSGHSVLEAGELLATSDSTLFTNDCGTTTTGSSSGQSELAVV